MHDLATLGSHQTVTCWMLQEEDVWTQLLFGIRYLDLR
jgi:hypothetical protein